MTAVRSPPRLLEADAEQLMRPSEIRKAERAASLDALEAVTEADTTPAPYSRNAAALLTIVGFCPCVVSHTRCVVLACLPTLSPPCLFPIVR